MPQDKTHGIKTFDGRVVYERRKHHFLWRDVSRLASKVDVPISRTETLRALDVLTHTMNKMLELPFWPFAIEAEPVMAKLESLKSEFVSFITQMQEKDLYYEPEKEEEEVPWWYGWLPQPGAGGPLKP